MAPRGYVLTSGTILGLVASVALGVAAGTGGYTFLYAKGTSYLGHDPAACANCHLMEEQYSAWLNSSHRGAASCNDCHTPANFVGKWAVKALNGYRHSFAFTTGRYSEPIQIVPFDRRITEAQCRNCHQDIVDAIAGPHGRGMGLECTRCHSSVGHLH